MSGAEGDWKGTGATKGRLHQGVYEFVLTEVTSQSRVYKQALDKLLRTEMKVRPRFGEFEVEISIELNRAYPAIDLDNVAKAVLDGIKGAVFVDDAQVMRLVVEKQWSERESVRVKAWPRPDRDVP